MIKNTYNLQDLSQIAETILNVSTSKILLFYGEMGVGKTTLIKEMIHTLGINEPVTSPTYSIINQYVTAEGLEVYHMDCYRINIQEEANEIGIEEYFDLPNAYTFIEWPQKIESLIPDEHTKIILTKNQNGSRTIELVPMP